MMNSEILIVRKTQKNQAYGYGLTYNSFWYLFAWKTPVESLSWGWVSRNAVNILTGDSNDHLLNYAITIWVKHIVIFLFVNILLDLASSAVKVSRIALNLWPYDSVNDLLNHAAIIWVIVMTPRPFWWVWIVSQVCWAFNDYTNYTWKYDSLFRNSSAFNTSVDSWKCFLLNTWNENEPDKNY